MCSMAPCNRRQLLAAVSQACLLLALACGTVQGGGQAQPAISVDVNTPSGTTTITQVCCRAAPQGSRCSPPGMRLLQTQVLAQHANTVLA